MGKEGKGISASFLAFRHGMAGLTMLERQHAKNLSSPTSRKDFRTATSTPYSVLRIPYADLT